MISKSRSRGCARLLVLLVLVLLNLPGQVFGIDDSYVLMSQEYVGVGENSSVVDLGLERRATSEGQLPPVRATLIWGRFGSSGQSQKKYVEWKGDEYGPKNVTLRLEPESLLSIREDDAVLVEVTHVTSGYIDDRRSKTLIGMMDEVEVPLFGMAENVTFTRGQTPELLILLKNGTVKGNMPSLVQYSYKFVTGGDVRKFSVHPIEQSGIVRFKPGQSSHSIRVPLSWKSVPLQSRFSIEMTLTSLFKARVQHPGVPFFAAHVLGTRKGVCPPGSADEESQLSGGGIRPRLGGEFNVTIGDSPVFLSLYGKQKDPITLYRSHGNVTEDVVAVVDTNVDGIKMCLSSPVGVTVRGESRGNIIYPSQKSAICSKDMTEYDVKLSIGWDKLTIRQARPDGSRNNTTLTLAVRRKADVQHTLLKSLEIVPSIGESMVVCEQSAPTVTIKRTATDVLRKNIKECKPDDIIHIDLDSDIESVQLIPRLLVDDVPGVRVEMNGQVVVYSGNNGIEEEQFSDSHPFSGTSKDMSERITTDAYIMNLPTGYEVPIEIVVFAEDGTTSSTLMVKMHRKSPSVEKSHGRTDISSLPSLQAILDGHSEFQHCAACMPGWVSSLPGSSSCALCPPGTFADYDGSRCSPCKKGTYAMSWGSNKCKHCIEGTFAPLDGSKFCTMCPESTTTLGDGKGACDAPRRELNVKNRYAVVIHVSVRLSGIDEDTLTWKSGVSGSPDRLITNLVTGDVAKAFNTTRDAVSVKSIRRLSDRNFETNVSASLPVYIPPSATQEDISTALEIERLSADSPLEMLAKAPDTFFGQTTDVLQAHVESTDFKTEDHLPERNESLMVSLLVIGSLGILGGFVLVAIALKKQRNSSSGAESRFLLPSQGHTSSSLPVRIL